MSLSGFVFLGVLHQLVDIAAVLENSCCPTVTSLARLSNSRRRKLTACVCADHRLTNGENDFGLSLKTNLKWYKGNWNPGKELAVHRHLNWSWAEMNSNVSRFLYFPWYVIWFVDIGRYQWEYLVAKVPWIYLATVWLANTTFGNSLSRSHINYTKLNLSKAFRDFQTATEWPCTLPADVKAKQQASSANVLSVTGKRNSQWM